jgi:prefoldin subunit 5
MATQGEEFIDQYKAQQAAMDTAEIKVKVIENGILVKIGPGWYTFKHWQEASTYIDHRINKLLEERKSHGR